MSIIAEEIDAVALAVHEGLGRKRKSLPPWLFYDALGSQLFEQITELPEYYLTRTERGLLARYADDILRATGPVSVVELGAGTATKTGLLLAAAARIQGSVLYQPVDVSPTALAEARQNLGRFPGVVVRPQVANYITERLQVAREPGRKVLALYIGSSIGNFLPEEALGILENLRTELRAGDFLLLGTDLPPGGKKPVSKLIQAYDDAQGVTAAFNLNVLSRLNREAGTDFRLECFRHEARWNETDSRMEMHLRSTSRQVVRVPAAGELKAMSVRFEAGETIHTENSYKFSLAAVQAMLGLAGFGVTRTLLDGDRLFAVTLAHAV